MRRFLTTAAMCCVAFSSPVQAEFLFGGDFTVERDIGYDSSSTDYDTTLRGEVVGGYDGDEFGFGLGIRFSEDHDDFELDADEDLFGYVRLGPVMISQGPGYGAGSILAEDYFALNDATALGLPVTRVDIDLGSAHVAVSKDDDGDFEFGLATQAFDHFVRVGYEQNAADLQVAIGRDLGKWGYHLIAHADLDDGEYSDQIAGTLLYDVTDAFRVAGNIAVSPDEGLHSYGVAAWYEFGAGVNSAGPATVRIEYTDTVYDDEETLELSINIPFGKPVPHLYERKADKIDISGFGYYD